MVETSFVNQQLGMNISYTPPNDTLLRILTHFAAFFEPVIGQADEHGHRVPPVVRRVHTTLRRTSPVGGYRKVGL